MRPTLDCGARVSHDVGAVMREMDVVIGRLYHALDGWDNQAQIEAIGADAYDDEDDAFERWLATVPTSNFERILHDLLDAESNTLLMFNRTA
jgi:hypothetical protein